MIVLPRQLQENLLTLLIWSDSASKLIRSSVGLELWDEGYQEIVRRSYRYMDKYKAAPGDHIVDLMDEVLTGNDEKKARRLQQTILNLKESQNSVNEQFILNRLNSFIRRQAIKSAIVECAPLLNSPEDRLDEIEARVLKAVKQRTLNWDPGTQLSDKNRALAFLRKTVDGEFLTGVSALDKLGIVPSRKALLMLVAPTGRGKCIAGSELVQLPTGVLKPIRDVVRDRDPYVIAFDRTKLDWSVSKVVDHYENGFRDCVRLTTGTGRSITTTKRHLYLTKEGWVPVHELVIGKSFIAVPIAIPGLGIKTIDKRKLRLLAYLIADGSLTQTFATSFTKEDPLIVADFKECVRHMGDQVTLGKDGDYYIVNDIRWVGENKTRKWLKELGLLGKKSNAKTIPNFIFELTDELIAEFLKALFSCDGSIWQDQGLPVIELSSASATLVEKVNQLLIRLGIIGRVKYFEARYKDKRIPGYAHVMITGGERVNQFISTIGFGGAKAKKVEVALKSLKGRKQFFAQGCRRLSNVAMFDRVVAIEPCGKLDTYDLAVPDHHNFVAAGMIVHNSWFLVNTARHALQLRQRVVYITLELSEDLVAQRMIQSLFAIPKRAGEYAQTRLVMTKGENMLKSLDEEVLRRRLAFDHPRATERFSKLIDKWRKMMSHLYIKEFPTGQLTVSGLESYLDLLYDREGFMPDMVIVDYPDLMTTRAETYRLDLGQIYKDIRGIAVARNMASVVVSQTNRSGVEARIINEKHIAEDFSKMATTDIGIFYTQTREEQQLGLARLYVAKARGETDKMTILVSQNYATGQFCIDSRVLAKNYWELVDAEAAEGDKEGS